MSVSEMSVTVTADVSQAEASIDRLLAKVNALAKRASELRGINAEIDAEVERTLEGIEAITFRTEKD